jgi:hypothetical protein
MEFSVAFFSFVCRRSNVPVLECPHRVIEGTLRIATATTRNREEQDKDDPGGPSSDPVWQASAGI